MRLTASRQKWGWAAVRRLLAKIHAGGAGSKKQRTVPPELSVISVGTSPSCVVVMPLRDHQVGHM